MAFSGERMPTSKEPRSQRSAPAGSANEGEALAEIANGERRWWAGIDSGERRWSAGRGNGKVRRRGGTPDGRGAGRDERRRGCAPVGNCASKNDMQSKERPGRRDSCREGHYRRGKPLGKYASGERHHLRAAPESSRVSVERHQQGEALAGRADFEQACHWGGTHRGSLSWPERRHRGAMTTLAQAASGGLNRPCSY